VAKKRKKAAKKATRKQQEEDHQEEVTTSEGVMRTGVLPNFFLSFSRFPRRHFGTASEPMPPGLRATPAWSLWRSVPNLLARSSDGALT
jgi:hypothetical protein